MIPISIISSQFYVIFITMDSQAGMYYKRNNTVAQIYFEAGKRVGEGGAQEI